MWRMGLYTPKTWGLGSRHGKGLWNDNRRLDWPEGVDGRAKDKAQQIAELQL